VRVISQLETRETQDEKRLIKYPSLKTKEIPKNPNYYVNFGSGILFQKHFLIWLIYIFLFYFYFFLFLISFFII